MESGAVSRHSIPSGWNLRATFPSVDIATMFSITRRPKPALVGCATGGPPCSRQDIQNCWSLAPQAMATPPEAAYRRRMQLYAIMRRDAWADGPELEEAAARSEAAGATMPDDVRWVRTYVLGEASGRLGSVCIYEASSPEAVRRHAEAAGLPCDEVVAVADTVVVNADPAPATT